jgi:DNA-binding NarL/FixJ family response regulator
MGRVRTPLDATVDATVVRRIGVVLVEPLPIVRAGLRLLLHDSPDIEVLVEAGSGEEALHGIARIKRSRVVVLVALGLGGPCDANTLIRLIRERLPTLVVLAVGANADAATVSLALFAGADGFVDKNADPAAFVDAVRQAAAGDPVLQLPGDVSATDVVVGIDRRRRMGSTLTEREREVLSVAAEGLTAREIAERLGVRERTVTTHLARIYGKLGVRNRLSAIRAATRAGLVTVAGPQ